MAPSGTKHAAITLSHDNGFDSIRLVAAAMVLVSHSFVLTAGSESAEPLYRLTGGQASLGYVSVAAFFVLSGLLIAGSFDRSSSGRSFWLKRAFRILPGLWVSVLATVLLFGPLFTTATMGQYFSSGTTFGFLRNLFFLPRADGLESVFVSHPFANAINGSLWTLRYEVACYAGCAVLMLLRGFRNAAVLGAWAMSFAISAVFPDSDGLGGVTFHIVLLADLFRYFGAGMVLYLWRDRIVLNAMFGWMAMLIVAVAAFTPAFTHILAVFGSYAIVCFGYMAPERFRAITRRGDISYGVYIYAFPVQQALVPLCLAWSIPWLANSVAALAITVFLACLSWMFVEHPAIAFGKRLLRSPRTTAGAARS